MISKPYVEEILAPEPDEKREERVRRRFWPTLRRAVRQIPFTEELVAAYFCALDPQVPARVRGTLLAALAYFVLPFDAVPDFILGIGFADDASVLFGAITMVAAHINEDHRRAARAALSD